MICSACRHESPGDSLFCEHCGVALEQRCPSCGSPSGAAARFCRKCGTALTAERAEKPAEAEVRKVVTIVFADLIGSTSLHERLDPESVSRVMDRYHRTVRAPVEAHGGTVVQLLGDGVMCAFGVPRVAEDDAIRAVRAAVGIHEAFREFAREEGALVGSIGLRVAVNTGEVVVSDDYAAGIGDPLNVAARLQQEAHDGDVLIGEATERLVRELVTLAPVGKIALKGRAETVAAFRVVTLERPVRVSATPFVGREDELRRIMAVHEAAVASRRARLAVILGSPGLGKSRLMDEVARRLGHAATVLTAQCDAAGGATFAPIARALRTHLGIGDAVAGDALRAAIEAAVPGDEAEPGRIASGIAALVGGAPAPPEETFFVVRRLLTALASSKPVVLAIDDLQWAEPLFLDLTEHLIQWTADAPLLVLVAARPELRETRSSLAAPGGLVTDVVTLAGLDASAATRLAANVIGSELPAAVAGRVLATSEGNPLFVGELVRMLVHDGALRREGDRWTIGTELARLEMPPTIQALLAARIERLRPEERTVLERAAIVGRQFSRAAVTHLLPREITDLDARLEALRRSELIESDTGWFLGEPALRFHHVLIRDAAYRRVLKNTRAELHACFADWLESKVGDAVEHDETMGWHLEQAHQHLRELGPLDAQGRALGERAARHLAAAGRRALARDDLSLAGSLLGRALDRLDAAHPERADLILDWCEALLAAGDVDPAARAIDELGRLVGGSERLRAWHACFAGQLAALTDPQALRATADAVAAAAETLTSAGDAAGEAKAHSVHALALGRLGRVGACEAALDRALAAARRAGDRRRSNGVLAGAPLAALWGPSPVTRASGRCLDVVRVLRITQGAPAVEAVALRCQGVLEALRGRSEAARRMIASSRRMVEELGITHRLLEADTFGGLVELLEGDPVAAERCLRPAYEGLRQHGLRIDAARAAALLGRALLAQGRAAEAETLSHDSEGLAGDDLEAAIAWRGVRAEALARRGEHASAVEFARAAVDLAAATDSLLYHADARMALAAALRAAGRGGEAAAEEARAIELWEAKGATVLAERARVSGPSEARAAGRRDEPPPSTRRAVRATPATALDARLSAAINARDVDALPGLFAEGFTLLDHVNGFTNDRNGALFTWRAVASGEEPIFRHEVLATLGDTLVLSHHWLSGSGVAVGKLDVGPYESDWIMLLEVDGEGRAARGESFPVNKLGDAIVRLYARYAEQLPDGPERVRAAATARSISRLLLTQTPDAALYAPAYDPEVEMVDHRASGFPTLRGVDRVLERVQSLFELATDIVVHFDDVLDARPDVLCVRWTESGVLRATGGAYERDFLLVNRVGPDGRVTRIELFPVDRPAAAIARCEALAGQAAAPVVRRRVRPNAAIRHMARLEAAIAARDVDALPSLFAMDRFEVVEHTTGATYGGPGLLATLSLILRDTSLAYHHEPLATLGESLALCRVSLAGGFAGRTFDVGFYEHELLNILEVDESGRGVGGEIVDCDRLGEAVARFYAYYAEREPDGPARGRAAATARTVAALSGPPDGWPLAPDVVAEDHRSVGFGVLRGADVKRAMRALFDLVAEHTTRFDDVLALRSDALLVRYTHAGTDRDGGAFERVLCELWTFGADGLVSRWEQFDGDRDAEALARFEALTRERAARVRHVRPNAATVHAARLDAAVAARDAEAISRLVGDDCEVVDHTTGVTYGGQAARAVGMLRGANAFTQDHEPIATLGESLSLLRLSRAATGFTGRNFDVGPYDSEQIVLSEVDASGRGRRADIFAGKRLGDALVRLYERHAELQPDGPARERAAAAARSVTNYTDARRYATILAPDVERVDRRTLGIGVLRGRAALRDAARAWGDLADYEARVDDILATRPDAFLVQLANVGTDRLGGGAFERVFLLLAVLRPDGLVAREEWFDADSDAEALARFDELTAPLDARRPPPSNRATAHALLVDAALAAGDIATLGSLFAERTTVVDHTTGASYGHEGVLTSWRSLLRGTDPQYIHELLATLGDSIALCRIWVTASGFAGATIDVGAYENESVQLIEVDGENRRVRTEIFAADRLGDAIAALYASWAEALPEGPARTRAAATARSVAAFVGPFDPDRYATAWDPAVVSVRYDGILALRPDAVLLRLAFAGTDRATGGVFELQYIALRMFGDDGRVTLLEWFDADRDAEALARFDEVTAAPTATDAARPPASTARRVPPNRASASVDRLNALLAARDPAAVSAVLADECDVVDYVLGMDLDRREVLSAVQFQLSATTPTFAEEALATLGDSLVLTRWSHGASGFVTSTVDVGPYLSEALCVVEVDAQGRRRRVVLFPTSRLGDAIARLYERHAELLPAGPAQTRAAATARAVACFTTPFDLARLAAASAPTIEVVDHRILGTWTSSGADALLRNARSLLEMSEGITYHVHDVLALRPDAILEKAANSGISAVGGGAFERPFLLLRLFGADGRQTRIEYFDLGQDAEARARFDELTAAPRKRRVVANAATVAAARMAASVTARDVDTFSAVLAEDVIALDHVTGTTFDRAGYVTTFLMGQKAEGFTFQHEPLASLGDSLALYRSSWSADRFTGWNFDVGPYERERAVVLEVDGRGLVTRQELFEGGRLGDAIVRLYERHAERLPEGPERARAAATARSVATILGPLEPDRYAPPIAADLEFADRRRVGLGLVHGADAFMRALDVLLEIADDVTNRIDDVLALRSDGFLSRWTNMGRDRASGGAYERPFLFIWIFGPDGLGTHAEQFDLGCEDEALARFEELTGSGAALPPAAPRPRVRPNAATAHAARFDAAIAARDVDALRALIAEGGEFIEHPTGGVSDREGFLFSYRALLRSEDPGHRYEPLATLGDTLALCRLTMSGSRFAGRTFDVGPFLREEFALVEVDASGRLSRGELFAADRLGDAIAHLYERYAAGLPAGPARERAAQTARAIAAFGGSVVAFQGFSPFVPAVETVDHRILGTWSAHGREELREHIGALMELAESVQVRDVYILRLRPDALLVSRMISGTDRATGGAFERPSLQLRVFGADGLCSRIEWFDLDREAEALARFDALTAAAQTEALRPDLLRIPPNAATRATDRWVKYIQTQDWDALRDLVAPVVWEDRRRLIRTTGSCDMVVANAELISRNGYQPARTLLATAGDRLMLQHLRFAGAIEGGADEIEVLEIVAVDAEGRFVAQITFDPDDRRAASAELHDRYGRQLRWPRAMIEAFHAINHHDLDRFRRTLSDDFVFDDHRRTGVGRLEGADAYVASIRPLFEGAPDFFTDNLYVVTEAAHGSLSVARTFGTLATGGEFESVFVRLVRFRDDRMIAVEQFELEDLDVARARFEEFRTAATAA